MKSIFFITVFSVFSLISFYVMLRGWQALSGYNNLRYGYLIGSILLFLLMMSNFMLRNVLSDDLAKVTTFIGYSYIIVLIYLLLSFIIADLVRVSNAIFHFAPAGMQTFRLVAFGISLIAIAIALIIGNYKFNHPEIVKHKLVSEKTLLGKELRIVAVSDLHLGVSINKSNLQKFVRLINEQKPDIVLLAGDIADNSTEPIIRQNMAEEFRQIQSTYGVFAVSGNHEYFGENPFTLENYLKTAGVRYLRDSAVLIENSFYVIGRDDKINPNRKKLSEITHTLDKQKTMILIDHQPFGLEEAVINQVDLQVSGHTHNGQFFPGNLIVKNMYEKAHGYLKKGNTHFYVSSGLGIWGPQYRLGTQSELVRIELKY
jgi:predicted MPP superfamily phosphohydrolase